MLAAVPGWAQARINTLIFSGRNNHDWRTTTPHLKKLLLDTGRFEVRVNEEPSGCNSEMLAAYDLLVLDYNGRRWTAVCEKAVEQFVRGGKGMVVVHGASYAFGEREVLGENQGRTGLFQPPWPEYARMVGSSWTNQPRTGHGKRHTFRVEFEGGAKQHPIASEIADGFLQNDELYHLMRMEAQAQVLARAFDSPEIGGTGRREPVLWTVNYGEGRVFQTTLGHDVAAMSGRGFVLSFTQGAEWAASGAVSPRPAPPAGPKKISALVVTGGHDYETGFYTLFQGYEDLRWSHAVHRAAAEGYGKDLAKRYDVLLLYDMPQQITEEQKRNLMEFARTGRGIVVLHHALASFQGWAEYRELIGGKYFLKGEGEQRASQYQHDIEMRVRVADQQHPVTRGLSDFEIHDEGYKHIWVSPQARVLLTTEHPQADRALAWISPWKEARVVTILLGHGEEAYANPSFRRLVIQAIRWAAGR